MSSDLPPGVVIGPPPAELQLGDDDDDWRAEWRSRLGSDSSDLTAAQAAKAFPERIAVDPPEALRTAKLFGCSGSVNSGRYREATRYRFLPDMGWEEARVAL